MKVWLDVPFEDKDLAKHRGAKWSVPHKRWYIEGAENVERFWRWMPMKFIDTKDAGKKRTKFNTGKGKGFGK